VEKKKDELAGFLVGLKGGIKALGAFASAMATIIGALLPFAVVLVVFGVPLWLGVRRSARRRQPKQPATT
jgi:cytochrome c oxidase assembly factor CtaG